MLEELNTPDFALEVGVLAEDLPKTGGSLTITLHEGFQLPRIKPTFPRYTLVVGERGKRETVTVTGDQGGVLSIERTMFPGLERAHKAGTPVHFMPLGADLTEQRAFIEILKRFKPLFYLEEILKALAPPDSPYLVKLWGDTRLEVKPTVPASNRIRVSPGCLFVTHPETGAVKVFLVPPEADPEDSEVELEFPEKGTRAVIVYVTLGAKLAAGTPEAIQQAGGVFRPLARVTLAAERKGKGITAGDITDLRDTPFDPVPETA
jgi:hypothetical protein